MCKKLRTLLLLLLIAPTLMAQQYMWTTQSENAAGSMPCGGGDIGLNVWVENGDILFYLSRSGTFDENNAMLKAGRVRIKLANHPFDQGDFRQELRWQEGGVRISGGHATVDLWVDVFHPVVHINIKSTQPKKITAAYESWRFADHPITNAAECRANSYKALPSFPIFTYKDSIYFDKNNILFYHRNRDDKEDVFDYTVKMEQLAAVKSELYNPVHHNTFGGYMKAPGMVAAGKGSGKYADTEFQSWILETPRAVRTQEIEIGLHVAQTPTLATWQQEMDSIKLLKSTRTPSLRWWQQFWERSYIHIGHNDTLTQNYRLFRYQLACNAYGKWPTKFNGGLFTFDPVYVDSTKHFSPDFRAWGGGTMTAQNQRLVYYPMLKNGDFDFMQSQFDFYLRNLHNANLRSQVYWGHSGACFTEQIENFGLPNVWEYEPKRPAGFDAGVEYNLWLEYQWETVFEFCWMMLETERYEGRDLQPYLPFTDSCLIFYDQHYRYLAAKRGRGTFDENGHYILYPTSAAETYKMTYNSTTVIAALQSVLQRLLEFKNIPDPQHARWDSMLHRIPPIAFREWAGHTTIAPAVTWARIQNIEAPQLYPVFPWGLYGLGKSGLDTARNTYLYDPHVVKNNTYIGWKQYAIFAARLGLTDEAMRLTRLKFRNGAHRFPTFWGPGYDWTPDHNWGGSAMTGLQEMLLQADGKKIFLFPAWPRGQDVSFRLHAPYNTTVEASLKDGKVIRLKVTPAERKADITIL